MKKLPDDLSKDVTSLRDKIVGLSESSGRKSYYPMLQQKIRELQGEITERRKAENALRETLERIAKQQTAIAEISTHPAVFHGRLEGAAAMMTATMAEALDVDWAGLWLIQGDEFCCVDQYDRASGHHESDFCLECRGYPEYFQTLRAGAPIVVTEAGADPRTQAFTTNQLHPKAIVSMLDVPVRIDGELVGIICFEQSAPPRSWQNDEITFASRVADQVALMLISKRRRLAEEQLREAHADLKRSLRFTEVLLEAVPIPIFYKDQDRRYLGCNQNFTDIMGLGRTELAGKTAEDFWPELADTYAHMDHKLFTEGGRQVYESTIRDKDNCLRDVIFAKQVFSDEHNQVSGIIGSFLDITDRNRGEAENARLRSLLANIINSMPSVLIGVDAEGRIAQWNQQAALETGLTEDEVQGQPLDRIIPWLHREMENIRLAISRKKPLFEGKTSRTAKGDTIYEDITIYPLITNGVEGAVIRIDNVTSKVRIEEMLVQSEKMLSVGGLAAGMAHEINNPLASIMGNAQVLETRLLHVLAPNIETAREVGISFEALRDYLEKRGIPKMLQAIRGSGAQAAQIVSNMLSFSRKSDSQLVSEDIVDLLDRTLDLAGTDYNLKKNYDFKRIEIKKEYENNIPPVLCAASKLQQVFLNLLRNGAEAMAEKTYPAQDRPRFTIRVRANSPWIRIEIEDNGPGMEDGIRKRIFEPFFTTKPTGKGTGLGLSVSYFIVTEGHGGRMDVQTAMGQWTRFRIDLPSMTLRP